jgi:hypothetical protein
MMDQPADRTDPIVDASVLVQGTYTDKMLEWTNKHQDAMRLAETRRVNDLANQRMDYEKRIADDLRQNYRMAQDHLAIELTKETSTLRAMIEVTGKNFTTQLNTHREQFATQLNTLRNEIIPAIAEINKFRYESGGKSAVADPATMSAIQSVGVQADTNRKQIEVLTAQLVKGAGKDEGQQAIWGAVIAIGGLIAALALVVVDVYHK